MWNVEPTDDYQRDHRRWEKKHREELSAVLSNLEKFFSALNEGAKPRNIKAGFVHPEPSGVLALDQTGAKRKLKVSRLYIFPDEGSKTLHLLRLGDKQSQPDDIQECVGFVLSLRKDRTKNVAKETVRKHR